MSLDLTLPAALAVLDGPAHQVARVEDFGAGLVLVRCRCGGLFDPVAVDRHVAGAST